MRAAGKMRLLGVVWAYEMSASARVYNNSMSTKKSSGLKYFSEESSGFKIQPKTVLIMSLIYIGLVVLLHIYAKLGATKPVTVETPTEAAPEPAAEAPQADAQESVNEEI